MKKVTGTMIAAFLILINCLPVYAGSKYSEESVKLGRAAGLEMEELDWEEIDRRQQEYRKRCKSSTASGDELHIDNNDDRRNRSVAVTDTADELHVYSDEYAALSPDYGAKYSYDEFHTAPKDIEANDGYGVGGFDELHINENYLYRVWHPKNRGNRFKGFDEFRYPDEM